MIAAQFAYGHVGLQTIKCSAPVRSCPGWSLINAAFSRLRQTRLHRVPVFGPDIGDVAIPKLRAGNAFHVGGETLRQPIVAAAQFGQREVHHFMDQNPVRCQLACTDVSAHGDLNHQSRIIGGAASVHAAARRGVDAQHDQGRRETIVEIRDDSRRACDPIFEQLL